MTIERQSRQAVSDLVDELVTVAKAELGPDARIAREGDSVVLEGHRLALRRIADVRLRDLVATAVHRT